MPRSRPSVALALATAIVATTIIVAPTFAANSKVAYFGSPDCANAPSGCPPADSTSSAFWSAIYPFGTGGGYDAVTSQPIAGQDSFSPVTAGGATATDIVVGNLSPSTFTQIAFNGGTAAPKTINTTSVPEMPQPPTPADNAIFNADGTEAVPSLPAGLYYKDVYVVSNPNKVKVSCSLTASAGVPAGLFDGLHCPIGNLASGQGVTLRVVVVDDSAAAGTYEPWFQLGLKEGASTTGSNSDTFLAYSELTIGSPECPAVSTFFLTGNKVSLSNAGVAADCQKTSSTFQTTAIGTSNGLANGIPATVGNQPSTLCISGVTCFGELSTASVALGAAIPGGVQWTIVMSGTLVPGTPKGAVHFLDDGTYQQIFFKHQYLCGTTITTFCWVSATKDSATGNWTFVFESPTNGSVRNF